MYIKMRDEWARSSPVRISPFSSPVLANLLTMRHALNSLAVVAPEWLQAHSRAEWVER
jgi:hypothetical protein